MAGIFLAALWRVAVAALAAEGLEEAFGIPYTAGLVCLLALAALELVLGEWFRRYPYGNLRRVFALVVLRLVQPIIWMLAAVGIVIA